MPTPSTTKTTFIENEEQEILDFSAIRLKLASPEEIHKWSHGEVTKPETINYRTQKPEKDGLFCEKIFGPSKDWECYCGKYKRIRYKGIICDKCGVEVTRSIVRRERMGHINLASPVSHIWFLRGIPSKIGLVLGLSIQELEKVIYFAAFIIIKVNEDFKNHTLEQIKNELKNKRKLIEKESEKKLQVVYQKKSDLLQKATSKKDKEKIESNIDSEVKNLNQVQLERIQTLEKAAEVAKKELKELRPLQIISENTYQDYSLKYGHVFEAGIGAEAIRKLLEQIDLEKINKELEGKTKDAIPSKKRKLIVRSKLIKSLIKNKIRPEWMILTTIPVIPPDLRPMVQLDGGRFATSDLNDLYRRVINRNNRLKRLQELNAPEVIQRNEKRMLQEAVDALIDNGARRGKTVTASTGQKRMLKSIADMLKGKQGRFRQNLLGKRVDYSGRSVIVIGPKLEIHQCGIPKKMALELFKPFVIAQLIKQEVVHNVRSANRYIDQDQPIVWDILEEITKKAHVLLNRAPTLHRLGIQAFQPVLIEGKAIQIHPMICRAFNADFDGDQMAVHVPLTEEAKKEAETIMLSTNNLLKPATGEPIITPDQDIVWGIYYLTFINELKPIEKQGVFANQEEALLAYNLRKIKLQEKIKVKINNEIIETSIGRIIFNKILPEGFGFYNQSFNSKEIKKLVGKILNSLDQETIIKLLDKIKNIGFKYITQSGLSWGINDIPLLKEKSDLIKKGEERVKEIQEQYENGLLTDHERYVKVIEVWTEIKNEITEISKNSFDLESSLYSIINSGARGSWAQMIQIMGMKGLVINPAGEIIELPVKANFQEGLDVLEYFISTHGTRKALSDTALRTANAGYLTRRLVDVAQDVVVIEEDCGDTEGLTLTKNEVELMDEEWDNLVLGRYLAADIINPKTKKVLIKKGQLLTEKEIEKIKTTDPETITIRSLLNCQIKRGVCQKCYGYDLGFNKLVELGTAVGIIAAQSIGEPGTQLTMRTFHTGGVVGLDITQGLPRVEELFEARPPKKKTIMTDIGGQVIINENDLLTNKKNRIIKIKGKEEAKEFNIPAGYPLAVRNGDLISAGDNLTEGSANLQELYQFKGRIETQKYIIKEILYIYSSQGQKLNIKHIEIIVRQMFSRMYVKDAGDTNLLPGEIVTIAQFQEENEEIKKQGKKVAIIDRLLLGITKASLSTDSFLSAASFQETARVLIDAAISGKIDRLRGLKENVIIGRQIPAGTGFKQEK